MTVYEQIADWIVNDSDDPVGEVESLLKDAHWGNGTIFNDYEDILEITEKKRRAKSNMITNKKKETEMILSVKAVNMRNNQNNHVLNQFIIETIEKNGNITDYFQSYDTIIVKRKYINRDFVITLDERFWDYSRTTGKYRNLFLNETKKETLAKLKSNEYKLMDLN